MKGIVLWLQGTDTTDKMIAPHKYQLEGAQLWQLSGVEDNLGCLAIAKVTVIECPNSPDSIACED